MNLKFKIYSSSKRSKPRILQTLSTLPILVTITIVTVLIARSLHRPIYAEDSSTTIATNSQNSVNELTIQTLLKSPIVSKISSYKTVTIKTAFTSQTYITNLVYVQDILKKFDYLQVIDNDDIVFPTLDSQITSSTTIFIRKVSKKCTDTTKQIPFKTETIKDNTIIKGTSQIQQQGKPGLKVVSTCTTYIDGELIPEQEVSEQIIEEPTLQIIRTGTKEIKTPKQPRTCKYWYNIIDKNITDKNLKDWFKSVMLCESGCNPQNDTNPPYIGLMQFTPYTFKAYGGKDIYNGLEQIRVVETMYERYGKNIKALSRQWPSCSMKYLQSKGKK